jgi:phage-related minor tail protein
MAEREPSLAESRSIEFTINADIAPFAASLNQLTELSKGFGAQLTGALKGAVLSGRDLDDVLRRIALNLAGRALDAGLKPLETLTNALIGGALEGIGIAGFAKGGVPGRAVPFAAGGVVSSPSLFPLGRGVGLMGEAGAEAIMPLARGADGRLGVAAAAQAPPVSIVFNVTTPDAASFRKSEAQITGMLARAVSRGARTL